MPKAPKGKVVSGKKYAEVDEKYDAKLKKKKKLNKTPRGIAGALKASEKEEGYSKMPRVKPQRKGK